VTNDLPGFIVIGAQKASTTALFEYLRRHPRVFVPEIKETNFFITEGRWHLGLDWYRSLYAGATGDATIAGDVSPGYTMFPTFAGAPARISSVVPDAKLVYVLRDPIERMRSHYLHQLTVGFERRPMRAALLQDIQYLSLSMYSLQLDQYLEHFDRSQLHVMRAEDLVNAPTETLDALLRFLGLEPGWVPDNLGTAYNQADSRRVPRAAAYRVDVALRRLQRHALAAKLRGVAGRSTWASRTYRDYELELDDDLRDRLRACLAPDVARLRTIVGPDFDTWGWSETPAR
jgi:hypothetical protein